MAGIFQKLGRLRGDVQGSAAVEFALVAPILVILTLAALDLASLMFDYHRASEATRRAARVAVATRNKAAAAWGLGCCSPISSAELARATAPA